jgi:hypothetical protein
MVPFKEFHWLKNASVSVILNIEGPTLTFIGLISPWIEIENPLGIQRSSTHFGRIAPKQSFKPTVQVCR